MSTVFLRPHRPSALTGTGSPEGVVVASPASRYDDVTNGVSYIKKTGTGNTGWLASSGNAILDRTVTASQVQATSVGVAITADVISVTFTVATKPVIVRARLKRCGHTVAGQSCFVYLSPETDTAATPAGYVDVNVYKSTAANDNVTLTLEDYITTPGTYTRKVRVTNFHTTGSAFVNLAAFSAKGAVLEAIEG